MDNQLIKIELSLPTDVASIIKGKSELLGVSFNEYINRLIVGHILRGGAETISLTEGDFTKLLEIGERLSTISPLIKKAAEDLDKNGF